MDESNAEDGAPRKPGRSTSLENAPPSSAMLTGGAPKLKTATPSDGRGLYGHGECSAVAVPSNGNRQETPPSELRWLPQESVGLPARPGWWAVPGAHGEDPRRPPRQPAAPSQHNSLFYPRGVDTEPPVLLHYAQLGAWRTVAPASDYFAHRRCAQQEAVGHTVLWLHHAKPRDRLIVMITPVELRPPLDEGDCPEDGAPEDLRSSPSSHHSDSPHHESHRLSRSGRRGTPGLWNGWHLRQKWRRQRRRLFGSPPAFAYRKGIIAHQRDGSAARYAEDALLHVPHGSTPKLVTISPLSDSHCTTWDQQLDCSFGSGTPCSQGRDTASVLVPPMQLTPISRGDLRQSERAMGGAISWSSPLQPPDTSAPSDSVDTDCFRAQAPLGCVPVLPTQPQRVGTNPLNPLGTERVEWDEAPCYALRHQGPGKRQGRPMTEWIPSLVPVTPGTPPKLLQLSPAPFFLRSPRTGRGHRKTQSPQHHSQCRPALRKHGVEVIEIRHEDITALDYAPRLTSSRFAIEAKVVYTYTFPSVADAVNYYGCPETLELMQAQLYAGPSTRAPHAAPAQARCSGEGAGGEDGAKDPHERNGCRSSSSGTRWDPQSKAAAATVPSEGSRRSSPSSYMNSLEDATGNTPSGPRDRRSARPPPLVGTPVAVSSARSTFPSPPGRLQGANAMADALRQQVGGALAATSPTDTFSKPHPHLCDGRPGLSPWAAIISTSFGVANRSLPPWLSHSHAAPQTPPGPETAACFPLRPPGATPRLRSTHVNTIVSLYAADPNFNAVLRELLMPDPGTHPYTVSLEEQRRMLALYETAMPAWAIFLASTGLPYRRLFRLLYVGAVNIWPLISLAVGLYDLYKHLPQLKRFTARTLEPLAAWVDQRVTLRVSVLATYLLSVLLTIFSSLTSFLGQFYFVQILTLPLFKLLFAAMQLPFRVAFNTLWTATSIVISFIRLIIMTIRVLLIGPFLLVTNLAAMAQVSNVVPAAAEGASLTLRWWSAYQEFWGTVAAPIKNLAKAWWDSVLHVGLSASRREASIRRWCAPRLQWGVELVGLVRSCVVVNTRMLLEYVVLPGWGMLVTYTSVLIYLYWLLMVVSPAMLLAASQALQRQLAGEGWEALLTPTAGNQSRNDL